MVPVKDDMLRNMEKAAERSAAIREILEYLHSLQAEIDRLNELLLRMKKDSKTE